MANIFLIYGNDAPSSYKKLDETESFIKKRYPHIQSQFFVEASSQEILSFVENSSLFGDMFYIRVKKIKGDFPFIKWKELPHILLIHSEEEKDPFPKESSIKKAACILPKPWDMMKLLQQNLKGKASPYVLEYLSQTLQSTLEITEIKKQMEFYKIDFLDIENIEQVFPTEDLGSFTLAEYFFNIQNPALFIKGVENIIRKGQSIDSLLTIILKKTCNFLEIKKGLQNNKTSTSIAQNLRLHPFIVDKMISIVNTYNLNILESLLRKIVRVQFLSRFYSSHMDKILITRLFLEQRDAVCH